MRIGARAGENVPIVGGSVAVAVAFAFIGRQIAVDISAEAGANVIGIEESVAIAIFALIEDSVAVEVGTLAPQQILVIWNVVAVAVIGQATLLGHEALNRILGRTM